MDGDTEVGLGIGVLRQERDTDAEECGAERAVCRYQERGSANMRREGRLMLRSVILSKQG
jgi:hypothetical protein